MDAHWSKNAKRYIFEIPPKIIFRISPPFQRSET